jgi:hypothetical protein
MRMILLGTVLLVCMASGCVLKELQEVQAAQRKYDECIVDATRRPEDCKMLKDDIITKQEWYHDQSERGRASVIFPARESLEPLRVM